MWISTTLLTYIIIIYAGTFAMRRAVGVWKLKPPWFDNVNVYNSVQYTLLLTIYTCTPYEYTVESYTELINKIEFLVRVLVTRAHCRRTHAHITIELLYRSVYTSYNDTKHNNNNIINYYRGNRVLRVIRAHILNLLPFVGGCNHICFYFISRTQTTRYAVEMVWQTVQYRYSEIEFYILMWRVPTYAASDRIPPGHVSQASTRESFLGVIFFSDVCKSCRM